MKLGRIFEQIISQENHTSSDGIPLGNRVLKVTVKCHSDSTNNAWIGWNEPATNKNTLQPDQSATYHDDRVYLDDNKLYVAFDSTLSGGKVLISIIYETEKENC